MIVLEFEAMVECGKWIDFKVKEWIKKRFLFNLMKRPSRF